MEILAAPSDPRMNTAFISQYLSRTLILKQGAHLQVIPSPGGGPAKTCQIKVSREGEDAIKIKEHKLSGYLDNKPRYSLYVNVEQCCLCKRQGFLSWEAISKGNTCFKPGPSIYSCILKCQHMCTLVWGCHPRRIWEYKENISRQMCINHEILFCT